MNALKVTLSAYEQAHKFIWGDGFLKMLSVPLLLTVLYFPVMVGACYASAAMVVEFFEGQLGLDGDLGGHDFGAVGVVGGDHQAHTACGRCA